MKILFLTPSINGVSETFIRDLITGLDTLGASLMVVTNDRNPIRDPNWSSGVVVKHAPFLSLNRVIDRARNRFVRPNKHWSLDRDTLLDVNAFRILSDLIHEEQPDVAFVEFGHSLARCSKPLMENKIPFVAHLHGADVTSHLSSEYYAACLRCAFAEVDTIVTASNHMKRLAILAGAKRDRVQVVRLGVNLEGVVPLAWEERTKAPPSIVFLGRMVAKKNPLALVEAFGHVVQAKPNTTLHMIGDGPELERAQQRGDSLGISESITWHGALERRRALSVLRSKWIYAQHSVTSRSGDQEGFGVSIAEASALQLPVVSTRHNGIPEQIVDGENGYLVNEFDFESMADRLVELISDPGLCRELGLNGRERIIKKHNLDQRSKSIYTILSKASRKIQ